jgi:hypothetical protein
MVLMGIVSPRGCGKTTVAKHLAEHHGFRVMSFAAPLKKVTEILFGFDKAELYGEEKEVRNLWIGTSARRVMQVFGSDCMRDSLDDETRAALGMLEGESFWVYMMRKKLEASGGGHAQNIVIDDVRFPDEIDVIRRHGGQIVYLKGPSWGFQPSSRQHTRKLLPPSASWSEDDDDDDDDDNNDDDDNSGTDPVDAAAAFLVSAGGAGRDAVKCLLRRSVDTILPSKLPLTYYPAASTTTNGGDDDGDDGKTKRLWNNYDHFTRTRMNKQLSVKDVVMPSPLPATTTGQPDGWSFSSTTLVPVESAHISESMATEMNGTDADAILVNDKTVDYLFSQVDALVTSRTSTSTV